MEKPVVAAENCLNRYIGIDDHATTIRTRIDVGCFACVLLCNKRSNVALDSSSSVVY